MKLQKHTVIEEKLSNDSICFFESSFANEAESYLLSDGLEKNKCLGLNLCRDIFFTSSSLINDVRFFGAILDPPSPPKIGHHLCTFPKETVK